MIRYCKTIYKISRNIKKVKLSYLSEAFLFNFLTNYVIRKLFTDTGLIKSWLPESSGFSRPLCRASITSSTWRITNGLTARNVKISVRYVIEKKEIRIGTKFYFVIMVFLNFEK